MRKALTAMAMAATVAASTLAMPSAAEARWWGWGGPAFFGGLAAGALIGGALLSPYYYAPRPYYAYGPYPYGPYPYYRSCWNRHWNGHRWIQARYC
jgi:hypothetical protein